MLKCVSESCSLGVVTGVEEAAGCIVYSPVCVGGRWLNGGRGCITSVLKPSFIHSLRTFLRAS